MSPLLQALDMDVRWRDMDAFQHVNNASYLGYLEEARVRWFRAIGADGSQGGVSPILAATQVNYRRAVTWPETVRVELWTERLGGKSLTLGHRILSATREGVLYADGHTVLVWIDGSGATVPLPEAVRAACAG